MFCVHSKGKHLYLATWVEGEGIKVVDPDGNPIEVTYAATQDLRTAYAYVEGVGFIGGWQYPTRCRQFADLVPSINRGAAYPTMDSLPKRRLKLNNAIEREE